MSCNDKVYDLIETLNNKQNKKFCLTCLYRLKHLLELFIKSDSFAAKYLDKIIPLNTIENELDKIIDKIYLNQIQNNDIDKNIYFLEKMLLDDDDYGNETEKAIFSYYVIILIHILEYIRENDNKYIKLCSDDMVEIINQAKFMEYHTKNTNCSDEEMEKYVDLIIDEEVEKEIKIIEIIQNGTDETLEKYIEKNKIEYNV
jgi:hypothetical protein